MALGDKLSDVDEGPAPKRKAEAMAEVVVEEMTEIVRAIWIEREL